MNQATIFLFLLRRNEYTRMQQASPKVGNPKAKGSPTCLRSTQYHPPFKPKSLTLAINMSICTLMRPMCFLALIRISRILLLFMRTACYGATQEHHKPYSEWNSNPNSYFFLLALRRRFPKKSRKPLATVTPVFRSSDWKFEDQIPSPEGCARP